MFVRVVRFSGVTPDRVETLVGRINESGGPPPGVEATGLKLLYDEAQQTAVVLQEFATAEAMQAAEAVFDSMDASETPGTRESVDRAAVTLAVQA